MPGSAIRPAGAGPRAGPGRGGTAAQPGTGRRRWPLAGFAAVVGRVGAGRVGAGGAARAWAGAGQDRGGGYALRRRSA